MGNKIKLSSPRKRGSIMMDSRLRGNDIKQTLIDCGRQFYERRWMWGTAGNLSLRLKTEPLEFAITPSGVNKGHLKTEDLITIRNGAAASKGKADPRPPSAETEIHQAIYRAAPGAGAVFHVHPVYSTLISGFYGHPREKR